MKLRVKITREDLVKALGWLNPGNARVFFQLLGFGNSPIKECPDSFEIDAEVVE